eukprot:GEMP01095817.1.p1 GENE.GEMP01095817.1~~GEMP01095817.1.p1  ORF type:complete len:150 (+),score=52.06 GEMP01095817.1:51-500(+)
MKAEVEEDSDPDLTPEEAALIEKNRLKALERYNAHLAKKKEEAEKAKEEAEKAKEMAQAIRASSTTAAAKPKQNTSGHPFFEFPQKREDEVLDENGAPNPMVFKKMEVKTEVAVPDGKEEKLISGTNARGKATTSRMFTQDGYFVAENC